MIFTEALDKQLLDKHVRCGKEQSMGKTKKQPTYNFYLHKNGERVNLKDLSEEEQHQVGVWAYQTIVRALGYAPVKE